MYLPQFLRKNVTLYTDLIVACKNLYCKFCISVWNLLLGLHECSYYLNIYNAVQPSEQHMASEIIFHIQYDQISENQSHKYSHNISHANFVIKTHDSVLSCPRSHHKYINSKHDFLTYVAWWSLTWMEPNLLQRYLPG